ncbi:hypothetical protein HAX39_23480 [Citrobacter freundii]|nr:hypothetical protein [Citrobacter freundii]
MYNPYNLPRSIEAIERILAHFPPSRPFLLDSGETFPKRGNKKNAMHKTYFLLEGTMMCCIGSGSEKQNLFLAMGPNIINIDNINVSGLEFSLEAVTPCLVDSINYTDFQEVISENDLWKDMYELTVNRIRYLGMRALTAGMQSSYEIIRTYLLYLENETAYNLKQRYTVVKFMQTFTRLSRSMILRVLAELKIGGFIELENGKLIRVCRKLPEKF